MGFVNALAILIFMAQVPHILGESYMTFIFLAITLLIIYIVPRFIKVIPAPLIAIVFLSAAAIFFQADMKTVGDLGAISQTLPSFFIPNVPFNLETLMIILPFSVALAIVGLLESLLTTQIVDDMTDTVGDKNKEARGQGIANFVTGFFGGMAGCAMIGQSVINVKSGGRGRLSTLIAGLVLMFLILVLGGVVVQIPMPVLVGIMVMVSIGTFDWSSFAYLRKAPLSDSLVMLVTVGIVVYTHDLSKGVIAGVILSAICFAAKISKVKITKTIDHTNCLTNYQVQGQIFFVSVDAFLEKIDFDVKKETIVLDFTQAHIWDDSGVGALDKAILKLKENGNSVRVRGLNDDSEQIVKRLAVSQHEIQKS